MNIGILFNIARTTGALLLLFKIEIRPAFATESEWTNWSETHHLTLNSLLKPTSRAELIEVIKSAHSAGKTVKIFGAGHSISRVTLPDTTETLTVSLEKYSKILRIDPLDLTVKIQSGATLSQLNHELRLNNLELENLSAISDQTVGGIIQTGTHGTGSAYGPIHTQIVELEVINGEGSIQTLSLQSNPELFRAFQCGLGVLGVVDSVTFRVHPAQQLFEVFYSENWRNVLNHIENLAQLNDRLMLYWFPGVEQVGIWASAKSEKTLQLQEEKTKELLARKIVQQTSETPLAKINQPIFDSLFSKRKSRSGNNTEILNVDCGCGKNLHMIEGAITIQRAKDFLLGLETMIIQNSYPAIGAVGIRFVKGDQAMLSPTFTENSNEIFCLVGLNVKFPDSSGSKDYQFYQEFFDQFVELVKKHHGRLHWGKLGELEHSYLRTVYPHWDRFRRIQKQQDPGGIFLNEWSRKVLEREDTL